ncbi:MAG TPA: hypothetical protein VG897_06170, partial [Terriglobales bacterium]|nr:hypothetical protein [Terriglobales bacterium]
MFRILASIVFIFMCASSLFADPSDEALRVQRYHDRLQQVGTGPATSVWVLLLDGEELKGTIYYLSDSELGIRD